MPLRQFEIATTASFIEVQRRVAAIVRPRRSFIEHFKRSSSSAPFEGGVEQGTFRMSRVIRGRNSFLPQIRGEIRPSEIGSVVQVRMTLHPLAAIFLLAIVAAVASSVLSLAQSGDASVSEVLAPTLMLVFTGVLVAACFYPEARKAERLIREAITVNGRTDGLQKSR